MGEHILSAFDEDLIKIQSRISEMGGLVEESLRLALESVEEKDIEKTKAVQELDRRINQLDDEIEKMTINVIALRQPMALDLRVLIAALKVSTTLERIGDLAENIAKRAVYLKKARRMPMFQSIVNMGRMTLVQLNTILDAYAERDKDLALSIWNGDVRLDETYNTIFRELVTYMSADPRLIGRAAQALFIAKNLERIGDHTTHIAEVIYYVVQGERLLEDRPKGEPLGPEAWGED